METVMPELIATTPQTIVSMCVFKDRLFVATSEGVFERDEDGVFREMRFVRLPDPIPRYLENSDGVVSELP
jgi:hypothetical protein